MQANKVVAPLEVVLAALAPLAVVLVAPGRIELPRALRSSPRRSVGSSRLHKALLSWSPWPTLCGNEMCKVDDNDKSFLICGGVVG